MEYRRISLEIELFSWTGPWLKKKKKKPRRSQGVTYKCKMCRNEINEKIFFLLEFSAKQNHIRIRIHYPFLFKWADNWFSRQAEVLVIYASSLHLQEWTLYWTRVTTFLPSKAIISDFYRFSTFKISLGIFWLANICN